VIEAKFPLILETLAQTREEKIADSKNRSIFPLTNEIHVRETKTPKIEKIIETTTAKLDQKSNHHETKRKEEMEADLISRTRTIQQSLNEESFGHLRLDLISRTTIELPREGTMAATKEAFETENKAEATSNDELSTETTIENKEEDHLHFETTIVRIIGKEALEPRTSREKGAGTREEETTRMDETMAHTLGTIFEVKETLGPIEGAA